MIAAYKDPKYSHTQALEITGLTAEQLQTWYKRGVVTEFTDRPKQRGIRRKYSVFDLMYLTAMKEIAAAGVPLLMAGLGALQAVKLMFVALKTAKPGAEVPRLHLLVWWPAGSGPVHPSHTVSGRAKGESVPAYDLLSSQDESIESWMEQRGITRAHVIDLRRVSVEFIARLDRATVEE